MPAGNRGVAAMQGHVRDAMTGPRISRLQPGLAGSLDGWVPGESFGAERRAADFPGVVAQRSGGALDRAG